MAESCHIFGIRHHGPGSARSLRAALEALSPDCILIEGPPEAEAVLSLAADKEMKPPVAILIHEAEKPQRAVYYPFAIFSPEWQAIQFGDSKKTPVGFMDLPQAIQMGIAIREEAEAKAAEPNADGEAEVEETEPLDDAGVGEEEPSNLEPVVAATEMHAALNRDPISYLAQAAGYSDSERWWEHMVEH